MFSVTVTNTLVLFTSCVSFCAADESDQFLFSWGRFLYDVVSLCEREAVTLLTVINSSIFSLNRSDGQREVSLMCSRTKTIWNSRLTCCSIINQEFRSFSRFLQVPVHVITYKCAGFTPDRDSLSWNNRLRSRSLSQDDFSWWTWQHEKNRRMVTNTNPAWRKKDHQRPDGRGSFL